MSFWVLVVRRSQCLADSVLSMGGPVQLRGVVDSHLVDSGVKSSDSTTGFPCTVVVGARFPLTIIRARVEVRGWRVRVKHP